MLSWNPEDILHKSKQTKKKQNHRILSRTTIFSNCINCGSISSCCKSLHSWTWTWSSQCCPSSYLWTFWIARLVSFLPGWSQKTQPESRDNTVDSTGVGFFFLLFLFLTSKPGVIAQMNSQRLAGTWLACDVWLWSLLGNGCVAGNQSDIVVHQAPGGAVSMAGGVKMIKTS